MQRPDQPNSTTAPNDHADKAPPNKSQAVSATKTVSLPSPRQVRDFDWTALGVVIVIAAFFALTARINAQPATSFVPIAVLSATGCGLLVTAIRKLHTPKGAGLFEAALGGFFIALFQFTIAITYPGVLDTLTQGLIVGHDFLITWGLIAGFSILFSIAGAALGHLAFAPLRPLPASSTSNAEVEEEEAEDSIASLEEQPVDHSGVEEEEITGTVADSKDEENTAGRAEEHALTVDASEAATLRQPPRSALSYVITILLLGLAPTVAAYVFSAAYNFTLGLSQLIPGPYPTLRLLSTLLPWQVPLPIELNGVIGNIIIFSLLWRIPLFLGNPTLFDLQALEVFVFNGAALGLLLLTTYRYNVSATYRSFSPGWPAYLSLEALLGLVIVLPANLWALRGLAGLLQFHDIVIPIRTLSILNPLTFSLNLITGPLMCMIIGIVVRGLLMRSYSTKAQLR